MIVLVLTQFAWMGINGGAKSGVQQEVYANARFVSEKIKYSIRNATAITSVTPTVLTMGSTVIDLVGGKVRLNGVNLNSDDTTISGLTFTDNGQNNVSFVFTLTRLNESVQIRSSATLRL